MNIIIDYKDFLDILNGLIDKNNPNKQSDDITQDDRYNINLNNNNNENAVSTETEFEVLRSKLYNYFKKNPDTLKIDMFNNQKGTFPFSSNGLELYKNYFNKIVATNNKKSLEKFMKGLYDDLIKLEQLENLEAEEDDLSDDDDDGEGMGDDEEEGQRLPPYPPYLTSYPPYRRSPTGKPAAAPVLSSGHLRRARTGEAKLESDYGVDQSLVPDGRSALAHHYNDVKNITPFSGSGGSADSNKSLSGGGKSPRYKSATTARKGKSLFTKIKEDIIFKTNKIIKELEEISGSSTGTTVGTGTGRGTGTGTGTGRGTSDKLPSIDNIQRFVGLTMDTNGDGLNIQYINNTGQMETRNIDFNNADFMSQLSNLFSALTEKGNTSAPSNLFDEATSGKNSNISLFGGDESEEQLRAQANFHRESAKLAQQKIDLIHQTKKTKDMEAAKANQRQTIRR